MHLTLEQKKETCLALLRSTKRPNIENLITHITKMGYFEAPGSEKHHRFKGGLLSHSLETYDEAMLLREKKIAEGFSLESMPIESVIIAALMHDLCKADVLRFNHRVVDVIRHSKGHSARSIRQIGYSGFRLTTDEKVAILWHMGGKRLLEDEQEREEFFRTHPLCDIILKADRESIRKSKIRHHGKRQ